MFATSAHTTVRNSSLRLLRSFTSRGFPQAAASSLDVAAGALAAGLYNAASRNIGVRIVADKGQDPGHDWDFSALVLRKSLVDSGKVKDFADLKGLNLVTSGRGNSPEVSLATALKKGGLTLQDVNYTQMGFPDMVTAIGTGCTRSSSAGQRGVRDYNDAFGPKRTGYADVVSILAQNTTVTDPKVYDQMVPAGLDPDGKLDVQSMQADLMYYRDSGQVQEPVDLSKRMNSVFASE